MSEKVKLLIATHQGDLDLNGFSVSCAVLEDGTRILVNIDEKGVLVSKLYCI